MFNWDRNKKLPDKLSDLLRLAVIDAKEFEAAGGKLNMRVWFLKSAQDGCSACMAGAVMRQTLNVSCSSNKEITPGHIRQQTNVILANKLRAIDYLREGSLVAAADAAGVSEPTEKVREAYNDMIVANWRNDLNRCSWDVYMKLANYLEFVGL